MKNVKLLFALLVNLSPSMVLAFDPFTVSAVVGTGANLVNNISDGAAEISSSAMAFQDLYLEIDSEAQISEDGQKILNDIHEIDALAKEAGYTAEELDEIGYTNPDDVKKLSSTLHHLTKAIRAGKRAARMVLKLEQKAKVSEVESLQIEREQLAGIYRLIRLENEKNLKEIKRELLEIKEKKSEIRALKKELSNKDVRVFGKTGVLVFPSQNKMIEAAISQSLRLRPSLSGIILFIYFLRVILYQFGLYGTRSYGDLIRDTFLCFFFLAFYPDIVRACLSISQGLASVFGNSNTEPIKPNDIVTPALTDWSTKGKLLIIWLIEWIKYIVFTVTNFLTTFGLAFVIMLFPLAITLGQMLNFTVALQAYFAGFLIFSLWPFLWNMVGSMAGLLWKANDLSLAEEIYKVLFTLAQFFSPLMGVKLLSGQSVSKTMSGIIQSVSPSARGVTQTIRSQVQGVVSGTQGRNEGGYVGRAGGWMLNQALSRTKNASLSYSSVSNPSKDWPTEKLVPRNTPKNRREQMRAGLRGFLHNSSNAKAENPSKVSDTKSFMHGLRFQPLRQKRRDFRNHSNLRKGR